MNQPLMPDNEGPGLDEQLVGYLDGELDARESSRVEEALAADPHVRDEVWKLERSWQLLDELPRTQVDESFTRSTVEMIAVKAEEDLAAIQAQIPSHHRRAWLMAGGLLAAATFAGFLTITTLSHRAETKLLDDLPVVENLDQYRVIEDLEFLRALKARNFQQPEAKHDR